MVSVSVTGIDVSTTKQSSTSGVTARVISKHRLAYPSGASGTAIINAESGIPTKHYVGSLDEHLYFKVADSNNTNYEGGVDVYFYDSPEHYLHHRYSRMRYASKTENEKKQKNEMLLNCSDQLVHWTLVDAQGNAVDNKFNAYMVPHINPQATTTWVSRRSSRIAEINAMVEDDN